MGDQRVTFEPAAYFQRIDLKACEPTLEGLYALQRAQMSSIPFEDIEPFLGQVPDLSPGSIWTKLVLQKRGGYCFELNHLFGWALEYVGFRVRPMLARVRMGAAVGGIRAHLAWIVTLAERDWLVDAGFGGPGPLGLIDLSDRHPQTLPNGVFRLRDDQATREVVLERQSSSRWFPLFGFDEAPFTTADIEGANFLCARSPVQPFGANLMMSMHRPDGYVSVMNRAVKVEWSASTQTWDIDSSAGLERVMTELFGLGYDRATVERLWARLAANPVTAAA
jgi:N-hydroxyarylamine O-acetyltransferase